MQRKRPKQHLRTDLPSLHPHPLQPSRPLATWEHNRRRRPALPEIQAAVIAAEPVEEDSAGVVDE